MVFPGAKAMFFLKILDFFSFVALFPLFADI